MVDPEMASWDAAPFPILVSEAGGKFTSLEGVVTMHGKSGISTNGRLHDEVLRELAGERSGSQRFLVAQVPESDQAIAFLVPKAQPRKAQAVSQRHPYHVLKLWVRLHALLQPVVRDPAAQVMDVVDPDVRGEPLERLG